MLLGYRIRTSKVLQKTAQPSGRVELTPLCFLPVTSVNQACFVPENWNANPDFLSPQDAVVEATVLYITLRCKL